MRALRLLEDIEPILADTGQGVINIHLAKASLLFAVGLNAASGEECRLALHPN